jgi:prepilin-type processing-associated H-X9-DG protein
VELLVVIAIIGILIALLLPAVQAARESARRLQCKNHLKQIGLACLLHEETHGFYPSGGWGGQYFPADPNYGYGKSQPGGWAFSLLPYLEENNLAELAEGKTGAAFEQASRALHSSPVSAFYCPSRRAAQAYPARWGGIREQRWVSSLPAVAKSDYAANSGDALNHALESYGGIRFTSPTSYAAMASTPPLWTDTNNPSLATAQYYQTGVIYYRSEVTIGRLVDGTSKTYLVGEKFLSPDAYSDVAAVSARAGYGENQSIYAGFEWDNHRVAWAPDSPFDQSDYQPQQDRAGIDTPNTHAFGSAHSGGLNMLFCDGSVQFVGYDIEPETHREQAVRDDNRPREMRISRPRT